MTDKKKPKKRKKPSGKTSLYKVKVNGVMRYVGMTNNLKRRETQHNSALKKGDIKELYCFLRENEIDHIELVLIEEFPDRTTCKRKEMLFILLDYFGPKHLKQSIPNISDRASSKSKTNTL